jgi:hypothetical protein
MSRRHPSTSRRFARAGPTDFVAICA